MAVNATFICFAVFLRTCEQPLSVIIITVPESSCRGQFGKIQTSSSLLFLGSLVFELSASSMASLHLIFPVMLGRGGSRDISLPSQHFSWLWIKSVWWISLASCQGRQCQSAMLTYVRSEQEPGPCRFRMFTWSLPIYSCVIHYHPWERIRALQI